MDFDALNRVDPATLGAALAGSPEEVARIIRVAAEGGAVEAQLLLGQLHLDGRGVDLDAAAALGWFGRAAAAGHAEAMNMVGRCIEQGLGTVRDAALAARWFCAAADAGSAWGRYNLATLLALGDGVAQDRAAALALFRRAAALGHAKSINMVGTFHEEGWETPPDRALAAAHYARAAEAGDFRGQFNHARVLIAGGKIGAARLWIERALAGGTPRFVEHVRRWMACSPVCDLLHDDAIAIELHQ